MGADHWDLSALNANRRHELADEVRRRTNQSLQRMRPERHWPTLLVFCHELAAQLADEVVLGLPPDPNGRLQLGSRE